ncbi:MAG TPA: hypothetical protein VF759_02905 [Allosphingosinicella sp.]|jgi:hypothetical protein
MKTFPIAASALLLALHPAAAPAQTAHENKIVADVIEDGTRPCLFFQLEGVASADPAAPMVWFAIPRTHMAFSELFALLLTARVLQLPVRVNTTGAVTCGFAAVDGITIHG